MQAMIENKRSAESEPAEPGSSKARHKQSPNDLKTKNNIDNIRASPILIGNKTDLPNSEVTELEIKKKAETGSR